MAEPYDPEKQGERRKANAQERERFNLLKLAARRALEEDRKDMETRLLQEDERKKKEKVSLLDW